MLIVTFLWKGQKQELAFPLDESLEQCKQHIEINFNGAEICHG